jgi:hypothetical protein
VKPIFVAVTAISALILMHTAGAASGDQRLAKRAAQLQARFEQADGDHDGKLTRAEAKAGMPRIYEHFDEIDTSHNGVLTLEDIKAYAVAKMSQRQKPATTESRAGR